MQTFYGIGKALFGAIAFHIGDLLGKGNGALGSGKALEVIHIVVDGTYILNSDESEQIKVQRYNAPTIDDYESEEFVTVGGTRSGYTFYYKRSTESDNSYQVLPNGEVGSLTAGTYSVYAIKKGEE